MVTDLQRKVVALSQTLPPSKDIQQFSRNYYELYEDASFAALESCDYCNPCVVHGQYIKPEVNEYFYFKILTKCEDFIVLRIVMMSLHCELAPWDDMSVIHDMADEEIEKIKEDYYATDGDYDVELFEYESCHEVAQIWFSPDGNIVKLEMGRLSTNEKQDCIDTNHNYTDCPDTEDFHDGFKFDMNLSPVEDFSTNVLVSNLSDTYKDDYTMSMYWNVTKCEAYAMFVKFAQSNNLKDDFAEMVRMDLPIAMTLKHWGYGELYNKFIVGGENSTPFKYYHTIKIAHRNDFDATTPARQNAWMDLLENIIFCNGNIQDPRNYMPKNFDEMFEYWERRVANKRKKLEAARKRSAEEQCELQRLKQIERTQAEDIDYQRRRALMLGIVIGNSEIELRVLQNVTEFYEEGKVQGFCVYSNNYFRFPEWLVFTCRDKTTNERLATVTYDLVTEVIVANLTKGNQVPERFDEIEALLLAHKDYIRRDYQKMLHDCPELKEIDPYWKERQESERRWNIMHREVENVQKSAILARRKKREEKQALLITA